MKVVDQDVQLMFITPDAAQLIERAGRICYKSEDKITTESGDKFVKMLLERGHESVIEHAYAMFHVRCDRGVSHEFVRHRIFSYSQESTRYCNYSKDKFGGEITVIKVPLTKPEKSAAIWEAANKAAEGYYFQMLEAGEPPEIARSVLPTDLKTELVGTANFREWRHFLFMRTSPKAHPQMREVANAIGEILYSHCPAVFADRMGR